MTNLTRIHTLGVIMNGVTGRMGANQHLMRSLVAIRNEGGVKLPNGDIIMPDPILVGRNATKLEALADRANGARWTTDVDSTLDDPHNQIYFDAQLTQLRAPRRAEGHRRRQTYLLREAHRRQRGGGIRPL